MFGLGEERPSTDGLVLEREEFEPTVFQLCADNDKVNTLSLLDVLALCFERISAFSTLCRLHCTNRRETV